MKSKVKHLSLIMVAGLLATACSRHHMVVGNVMMNGTQVDFRFEAPMYEGDYIDFEASGVDPQCPIYIVINDSKYDSVTSVPNSFQYQAYVSGTNILYFQQGDSASVKIQFNVK